jgi:hypothetical protein
MSAAVSTLSGRLHCLCMLGCFAIQASAQEQSDAPYPGTAVQQGLRLELSSPTELDPLDRRLAVTGWGATATPLGAGWGVGMAVPVQSSQLGGNTGVDLGLRWRSAADAQGQLRASMWLRAANVPDSPSLAQQVSDRPALNTRLELQFGAASAKGVRFELGGALGMQLSKDEKLMLRASRGKPMLYYRAQF